ncbi:MAG: hypothetical protein KKH52_03570 [Nanoarchaeota archaeon]|nr:hypothetical protein [Nanoarchaeota archaeon]
MNLFREIFTTGKDLGSIILVSLLLLAGLILMFVNFSHFLPKKMAYLLSSPLIINLTAYVIIAIVYSRVPVDLTTILAGIIFFFIILLLFTGIGFISRKWWIRIEHLKSKEKVEDVKKEKKVLEKTKGAVKEQETKINKAIKTEIKEVKQRQTALKQMKQVVKNNNHKKKN